MSCIKPTIVKEDERNLIGHPKSMRSIEYQMYLDLGGNEYAWYELEQIKRERER